MATTTIRNKWVCQVCGYIYDSATGDSKGGSVRVQFMTIFPIPGIVLIAALRKVNLMRWKRIEKAFF